MSRALDVIQRIRDRARTAAEAELRRAEVERDRQQARVDMLVEAIADARAGCDEADVLALNAYHGFRLQGEMATRREEQRLHHRNREVESRSARHVATVRDQLAVESLIERRAEERAHEESRREAAQMDEIGARLRRLA